MNGYKMKTHIFAAYKRPISDLETNTDWKQKDGKWYPCKWKSKEARVAILISDIIHFKVKNIARDKKELYIMIKGSIWKEDITTVNICVYNIEAPPCMRQILRDIKMELEKSKIIVGGFNTLLIQMDRAWKTENQLENTNLKWNIRPFGLLISLEFSIQKWRRIHFLLKRTWNIHSPW